MAEHWKGDPERILLVVPYYKGGLVNGRVYTDVQAAAETVQQHGRCRVDIIYRDRPCSWCYEVDPEEHLEPARFLLERVEESDQEQKLMPQR